MVLASRVFSIASSRSKQTLGSKSHLQNNQKHASAFAPGVLLFFLSRLTFTLRRIYIHSHYISTGPYNPS